jgi:hypothetical protein
VCGGGALVYAPNGGKSAAPAPSAQAVAEPSPPPALPPIVAVSATARLGDEDREALRALIREELRAGRAEAAAGGPAGPATSASAAASQSVLASLPPESAAAYQRAQTLVDDGIARGTWSEADRAGLQAELAPLPGECDR